MGDVHYSGLNRNLERNYSTLRNFIDFGRVNFSSTVQSNGQRLSLSTLNFIHSCTTTLQSRNWKDYFFCVHIDNPSLWSELSAKVKQAGAKYGTFITPKN